MNQYETKSWIESREYLEKLLAGKENEHAAYNEFLASESTTRFEESVIDWLIQGAMNTKAFVEDVHQIVVKARNVKWIEDRPLGIRRITLQTFLSLAKVGENGGFTIEENKSPFKSFDDMVDWEISQRKTA